MLQTSIGTLLFHFPYSMYLFLRRLWRGLAMVGTSCKMGEGDILTKGCTRIWPHGVGMVIGVRFLNWTTFSNFMHHFDLFLFVCLFVVCVKKLVAKNFSFSSPNLPPPWSLILHLLINNAWDFTYITIIMILYQASTLSLLTVFIYEFIFLIWVISRYFRRTQTSFHVVYLQLYRYRIFFKSWLFPHVQV